MAPDLGLLDSLVQLSFAVHGVLERVAERHELSLVQVRLLGILRDRELGMLELAAILRLDKSSVTGLIDRAERRGLVRRRGTPEDKRAVKVSLSPEGRTLVHACVRQLERELASLVEDLSEADRKRLSVLATQVVLSDTNKLLPLFSLLPRLPQKN